MSLAHLLVVAGLSALAVVLVMLGVLVAARRTGRVAVVDVAWGLGFIAIALVSAVVGSLLDGATWREWLVAVLVVAWAGRLSAHIARRARGQGEDPRYEKLMASGGGIARKVLVPQGLAMWFVSLPVQVGAVSPDGVVWVVVLGVVVWAVGLSFEAVGDAQLTSYKADPARGPVMDRGLWRYTRHPNYFGDACVWWGIWLVCASAWPGVLTVLSPVAMTFFLVFATGARLLEQEMMTRRGYPEYAARTSMFVPLPPRRAGDRAVS